MNLNQHPVHLICMALSLARVTGYRNEIIIASFSIQASTDTVIEREAIMQDLEKEMEDN